MIAETAAPAAQPVEPRSANWWEEDAATAARYDDRYWDNLYDRDED